MAEAPVKDVFADDEPDDDQRVVDEAEEAEQQREAEEAATKAGTDDIEVVLAEAEEAEPDEEDAEEEPEVKAEADDDMAVEDDVDEDLKSYSKKVQDRIARERRLVKRAREEAAAAVSGERAKRIDAERKSLTAHKNLTAVLLVNIESQLKAKSTELKIGRASCRERV